MKENQGTMVNILTVLLILTIIAIIIMGYFIYKIYNDKEIDNSQAGKIDNKISNIDEPKENEDIENKENNKYAVLELSPIGGIAVLYNGEVYANVQDSTSNIDDIYGDGKYQTLINTRTTYKEYSFENLQVNNNETKWGKLNISNIKEIHNNIYGQAMNSSNPKYGIIMIDNDNKVYYISIRDLIEGNTKVTQLNVSNVADIVSEDNGEYTTYFINNNGKKEDVNRYIH